MNIGKQIHTLLKRQASVYVKGLGVFKRIHTPATFDAKKNVFLPPITFIEFDSTSGEGYDFVTFVQQSLQLDRTEAMNEIDMAVSALIDKINQSGQANLDSLGHLISYGNSYVFKPLDLSGFNYQPVEDKFYVEPVQEEVNEEILITSVEEQEVANVEEESTEESPIEEVTAAEEEVVKETVNVVEEPKNETVPDPILEEEVEEKSSESRSYIYGLVAALAVIILGAIYYFSTKSTTVDNSTAATSDTVETIVDTDSVAAADSLLLAGIAADSTAVLAPTDSIKQNEAPKEVEANPNHKYQIVIGSHRTLAQAYEQAEAYQKDGHKSVRVVSPNLAHNRKKVIWDTYATKAEVDSALRYVQKHIIADAWPDKFK